MIKFDNLKEKTCPFCGKSLIFNKNYTKSNCQDPSCQYNNEVDLSKFLNPKLGFKRAILVEWVK